MKSFHNDPKIKEKYLNRLKAHAEADELIQGEGWRDGKGCAVGCTLENYNHARYEKELGIPEWMARLYDCIFEGLPNDKAKVFAIKFLQSVPVGVDLNPIKWKFPCFVLKENIERVMSLTLDKKLKEQVVSSIRQCLSVHKSAILNGAWNYSTRSLAWSAADSAAESVRVARSTLVAESAADSAAESMVESLARSTWLAAESARPARSEAYERYSKS